MKVNVPRFTWLFLSAFLASGLSSHALVNTSDPADPTEAPSASTTPTPTPKPSVDADRAAQTPAAPAAQTPPAPQDHAVAPAPSTVPAPDQASSAETPEVPDAPTAKHHHGNGNDDAGPGNHHVSGTEPARDVVSIFGNSTADVEVDGAVVSVLGSSTAHKDVSQAVVSVLGNSRADADVGESVVSVLGNASANGHVHENVVAVLGNIDLGPHAEVDGNVVSVGGQVHVAPGAIIHGNRTVTPVIAGGHLPFGEVPNWFQACILQGRFLAFRRDVMWAWIPGLIFLAGYVLFGLVFSTGVRRCAETLEQRPGWTILATLLTVVLAPLLVLVLADLAIPTNHVALLTPDALGALRLMAIAALAVGAALAVQASAVALAKARIPFAQTAGVLLVVFDFTLVFVGAEDSAYACERRGQTAAALWTDEALASLPPNGLVLLRSEAIAWRLLAARIVRGERPDLIVVPTPLLERGNVRARLLAAEPALAPLVREVALSGHPSEYALSTLADARPLFVEFDSSFDHAQLEHLIPQPFFMHFAPEPLGRSDRIAGLLDGADEFQAVIAETTRDGTDDAATRSVLVAEARGQALVAAALGDRKNVDSALATVRALDENDALARDLAAQAKAKPRGELSLAKLLPTPVARAR